MAEVEDVPMEDSDLVKIIEDHINKGIGSDRGELSSDRLEIHDRYNGKLYGDERDGEGSRGRGVDRRGICAGGRERRGQDRRRPGSARSDCR